MAGDFRSALRKRPLVLDGAMGTMLQRLGLKPGGCPDEVNLNEPGMVRKVHRAYVEAGSDVLATNTFGANRIKLKEYNLEDRLKDINVAAARLAREAAGPKTFVAGDMGPTGFFIEPVGGMTFDEAVEVFSEQAGALKEGGADLIIIETMMDIKEMKAAIIGAKSHNLPVVATMTFDETMRTVLGTPPESFAVMAESLGVDCIGANCSLGIEGILKAVSTMSSVTSIPLMAQPNAGIPVLKDGHTVFPASPEDMASLVPQLAELGVRLLGGCCGTTPEHIKKMSAAFKGVKLVDRTEKPFTALSARTSFLLFGGGLPPVIIGERINPTGRKVLANEIKEGKISTIRKEAREQTGAGAHCLDVNVGVPGVDEVSAMRRAVFAVNENCPLPIVIDSSNPEAMETGLKAVDGKPLINSISGEEKKLSTILPLAKKYGAAVLGLALDDSGIPETAEGRLRVAEKILKRCLEAGLRKEDIIIDCLAMTVSAAPDSAVTTLEAIRLVKEKLGLATALGVSNISFGLPARGIINANFLSMAISAGLDSAIINPKNASMMDAYHSALVLTGKDTRAERFIEYTKTRPATTSAKPAEKAAPGGAAKREIKDIRDRLKYAIVDGDEENIVGLVEEALSEGLDPMAIGNEGLIPGLTEVGRLFACNTYFLPQVMLSAETMKKAFTRLKKEFKGKKGPSLGKVLLATVEGDIHDIGKNIVATLLENHGFEVLDLGKNVPTEKVIEEAVKNKVDVVGLSALMTTTVTEMDNVIRKLKERGIKAATIVGGAVVTDEYSKKIGATEYGGDALSAVDKIKRLVGK
ncbi:MAG: homocysteine S-methyltransferase family protein [Thermodesulfobacteriota bacterium]